MSALNQVKQQIAAVSSDARSTAQGLAGFKSKFSESVSRVNATLSGSAQNIDKELIQVLSAAEKQVDQAVAALMQAAEKANRYAQSL